MRRKWVLGVLFAIAAALTGVTAWQDRHRGEDDALPTVTEAAVGQGKRVTSVGLASASALGGDARDPLLDAASDPFQPVRVVAEVKPAAPLPPPAPPKPVAPPLPYRYFGRMTGTGNQTFVYLQKDDALIPIEVAQVLDGVYRIDKITDAQITLTYLPLNEMAELSIQSARP